ncbi:hypothetical protein PPERSA_08761 [Pseudocohnilembus persalinus]|uniref:Uncharacterized protein n=1 Tax=Pseudocohnilembus persalinus TaxID=266149 RepID=A0A0V0R7K6_PSEPJ|nr:hypothetical protein PPERSA_08761 [Pseudocohnilembus persalinus]|eukprot:KRX10459.1 hypothetical protein PPERSA_08761 [Pseudocohnilembus persalinus]
MKIQQNSLYQIDLYKDEIKYLKFELQDQWPIKIKVESISGEKFDLYFSFSEHFPTDKITGNDNYTYINKAEHLYQFFKPKFLEEQYLFIGLKSKEQIKVNTKIWVSDFKMDQKRAEMYKKYVKTRAPVTKKYVSYRKSKLTKFDQEQQQQQDEDNLKREVENILKKRKKQNKSLYQVNILERNRQIADNLQIYQQKKNIDILMHGMKCEQNYQKKIFLEQQNIQNTIEKIEERRFLQQYKIYLRNKEIKRAKLNIFSKQWLVLLEITKVIQKMDERMKLEKLVDIFRNYRDRVQRAFRIQFLRYKDKRWGTRNLQLSTFMEARKGDKIEIMLRYISIQKQKMGRLYKIKKNQIEGTQNDMVFYYEALTQNQVNEQKIEENQILEIIDPVEIQIKKYLKLKNAELLFRQKYKKQEKYGLHQNLRDNPELQNDIYYSSDFQIEQEWFLDYYQDIYKINKEGYQIEKMRKSIQSKNLGIQKFQENKQEEGFFLTQDKQLQNQNNVQKQQQQQNKVNDIEEKNNEENEAKQMRLWYIVKKQKVKDLSLYIIEDRDLLQEFLIDVLKRKEKQEMEMEEIQQAINEKQQEIQKSQEEKAQNELKVFLQK